MDVIKKINDNYILIIILIVAALIRLFPIDWDGGYYTHPDERHIYSVVSQLDFPDSIAEFFSKESTWDPHFYAYGSLPLYLLHFASQAYSSIDFYANTYQKLYTVARPLSAYFDLGTVILVYLFIKLFTKDKRHSLLGAALYAILVFPIQNAHFYTVDTQLTFWCVLTLFLLTKGVKQLNTSYFYVASVSIAAAVSTKIIGLALFASFGIALLIYVLRLPETKALHKVISFIKIGILSTSIILFLSMLFQPYVFLNWETFMNDISVQTKMRTDATVFPYTIQYLTTTNYLYPIKQIINWGMGIVPTVIGMVGFVFISFQKGLLLIKNKQFSSWLPLIVFAWIIFLFMGASAVKFMRYYLPLYPLLVISGTVAILMLLQKLPKLIIPLYTIIFLPTFMWLLAFMSIYTKPHPWIQASDWILTTIPSNETIATEHWDNVLPLYNSFNYSYETLELYIPDSENKINKLVDSLEKSNYIVIATNRLTDSIPRWPDRYPATIEYYNKLLNERLGFSLIAEFTSYPSILGYQINDQTADESFTVYDHPRVRVFQKNNFDVDEVRKNLLHALE